MERLREIGREEQIDLVFFGCIRGRGDTAKALALGATAVMLGQTALIAAGAWSPLAPAAAPSCPAEQDADEAADSLARFVQAMSMETAILARSCGKTDVHNLEPEDLRALSIAASEATGVPLVGKDLNFRSTARPALG